MQKKDHIDRLGATLLIAIMITLGLNQVAVKLVNEAMAPVFQAGLRSLLAIPLLAMFCMWRQTPFNVSAAVVVPGVLSGIAFASEFALLFEAFQYTTVSRASVFFYTMPFWVAAGAHFLFPGERLTFFKIIGLILAACGVAIALSNNATQVGGYTLVGDLMALLAATFWASIALLAKGTALSRVKPEIQLMYQIVVSAPLLLIPSLLFGETLREPELWHWAILGTQVVVVICLCFLTWFWVLSVYPASDMASFSFLAPVFGVFFSWLILEEPITWSLLVALVLVAIGIVLVNRK